MTAQFPRSRHQQRIHLMNTLTSPAFTYAKPSGAVNAVAKMHVDRGGKEVRYVIGKDPATGRYYPVFVDRIKPIGAAELAANPSANVRRARKTAATRQTASAKKVARKAPAKKAAKRPRKANTLH